jgi:hypothetical protein
MENFWYKNLECADYDKIKAELYLWLEPQLESFKQRKLYYENIVSSQMLSASPTLVSWLDSLGTGLIRVVGCIYVPPNYSIKIQTDNTSVNLGLNIGLQTKDTHTILYDIKEGEPNLITYGEVNSYISYETCVCEEHTRFDLTNNPVIFNLKQPHNVVNPTDVWRLSISIRFQTDPLHLIT